MCSQARRTPLHEAISNVKHVSEANVIKVCQVLLEHGAIIDVKDRVGIVTVFVYRYLLHCALVNVSL